MRTRWPLDLRSDGPRWPFDPYAGTRWPFDRWFWFDMAVGRTTRPVARRSGPPPRDTIVTWRDATARARLAPRAGAPFGDAAARGGGRALCRLREPPPPRPTTQPPALDDRSIDRDRCCRHSADRRDSRESWWLLATIKGSDTPSSSKGATHCHHRANLLEPPATHCHHCANLHQGERHAIIVRTCSNLPRHTAIIANLHPSKGATHCHHCANLLEPPVPSVGGRV